MVSWKKLKYRRWVVLGVGIFILLLTPVGRSQIHLERWQREMEWKRLQESADRERLRKLQERIFQEQQYIQCAAVFGEADKTLHGFAAAHNRREVDMKSKRVWVKISKKVEDCLYGN